MTVVSPDNTVCACGLTAHTDGLYFLHNNVQWCKTSLLNLPSLKYIAGFWQI